MRPDNAPQPETAKDKTIRLLEEFARSLSSDWPEGFKADTAWAEGRITYYLDRADYVQRHQDWIVAKTGGTPAWRNNNTGNIKFRKRTQSYNGAVGRNSETNAEGSFVIFSTALAGALAHYVHLNSDIYRNKSIADAIKTWCPPSETGKNGKLIDNHTNSYINFVREKSGLDMSRRIIDLSPVEFVTLVRAMHKREGWEKGEVLLYNGPS